MADSDTLIGQTISHYRIIEKLGGGGMGVVYRGHDDQLDRDVALKVLPHGRISDESSRRRFRKEALALAKLNHPNIETVHEFASQNEVDFLVTEYIEGKTLAEVLSSGPLSEKEVALLGAQMASALEDAHERNIIHCDLKPGNMILTAKRQLKVLDFGLARLVRTGDEVTTEGVSVTEGVGGTLPYMAPEQLGGKAADVRTDVYAMGLVLYEMATGMRAFRPDSVQVLVGQILNQMPAPVRQSNPNVSAELERIIFKACDKDPERRYQSAKELRIDLERLATPSTARVRTQGPETPWEKLWRVSRKHPLRVALSVVIIGAAVVAIFWFAGTQPVLSFVPRDWILLTDFDNQTGEAVFDRSLLTALTVSLEQSAWANVFPRARIPETLKRMGKPTTQAIDENIGREICARDHIRGLVSCRIARIGQEYVLSAELIDPQTGESKRSYLERVKGQERVLTGLDKIANRLRRDLGESLSTIEMDRPLPQVTTSSLEALKSYVDGLDAWRKAKFGEAVALYKRAVELDPDFAMAHAALGNAYSSFVMNSQPVDGKAEYEKALQLSTRTTERERLLIQIAYADKISHDADAYQLLHIYLDKYPDDSSVRYNFATGMRDRGHYQEAIDQFLQVLRIAPENANAYINLATSYVGVGKLDDALRSYDKAFALEPTWKTQGNLNHEYGFALIRKGDDAAATKVFEEALQRTGMKGQAERSMGWLALYHGHYREAKKHFETSLLAYKADDSELSETRTYVLLSIVAGGEGDRVQELHELAQADALIPKIRPKVWMGSMVGGFYARAGAPEKAEKLLQSIKPGLQSQSSEESGQIHMLEGEIALARGKTKEALNSFNLAQNERPAPEKMEALARAYSADKNLEQSREWYEKVVETLDQPLGWETQQDFLTAHYELAKLYLAEGQKDKAANTLGKLLALWKDADQDLPVLKQAKAEYAKLQ